MPIPMTPGCVSTDVEADYFKISALIKFSKVPEIINLKTDLLFSEANKFIHKFDFLSMLFLKHMKRLVQTLHMVAETITIVQLLTKVKKQLQV